jgi:hypothetical protein
MNNKIKTVLVFVVLVAALCLASCKGRIGEDVIDGDEYQENITDGIIPDERNYNSPAEMLDMSPDSANIMK